MPMKPTWAVGRSSSMPSTRPMPARMMGTIVMKSSSSTGNLLLQMGVSTSTSLVSKLRVTSNAMSIEISLSRVRKSRELVSLRRILVSLS